MDWVALAALLGVPVAVVTAVWPIVRDRGPEARLARLTAIMKDTDDEETRVLLNHTGRAVARRLAREAIHGADRLGAVVTAAALLVGYLLVVMAISVSVTPVPTSPLSYLVAGVGLLLLGALIYTGRALLSSRDTEKIEVAAQAEMNATVAKLGQNHLQ